MGDTDLETMANVTIAEYDYEDEAFDKISDLAKDFIDHLLVKEKKKRMTAIQCLEHEWLNPKLAQKQTDPNEQQDSKDGGKGEAEGQPLDAAKKNLAESRDHWDQDNNYVMFDSESRTMSRAAGSVHEDEDKSLNADSR